MIAGNFNALVKFFTVPDTSMVGKPFPEKWFETNYFKSPVYVKSNLKTLKKEFFFLKWDKLSFYFLRERYNSANYRFKNDYLINKPSIKETIKYFLWVYPKSKIKRLLN
jgi:hypothetical protein